MVFTMRNAVWQHEKHIVGRLFSTKCYALDVARIVVLGLPGGKENT